jgi:hypothetical protein
MSHTDRWAQLFHQALHSLLFAFYNSQGQGGVIPTHLHEEKYEYTSFTAVVLTIKLVG